MNSKQLGNFGERIAEKYLKNKGYQILDRNYSFQIPENPQSGEIDLVAKKGDVISFIEVKTLRDLSSKIRPEEKVNSRKQRKIIKTAENWLMRKKIPLDSKWEIEVISIKINLDSKRARIHHFQRVVF